jgi:putative ABC transport system permease protein
VLFRSLTLAKGDLLSAWQTKMPPDAPNRFLINIQPEQRAALAAFFTAQGIPAPRLEPMVRARLTEVNGKPVVPADYADERARRLAEREFNLSSRADLPVGNTVVAGHWHADARAAMQFSVEQGLAKSLGLALGDELRFSVAGQYFSGAVTSLRQLDWDSMRVNFFVIAPAGALDGQPTSYITSLHLPAGREMLLSDLARQFPNITAIDVAALIAQLRATLDQVIGAVQFVFMFSLGAGLLVLYAAIQAGSGERGQELAVLRALGARHRQLQHVVLAEFLSLGTLAGLLAGGAAMGIGAALGRWVFQLDVVPGVDILLAGVFAGLAGVGLAGLLASRRAFGGSVLARLRAG